MKNFNEKFFEYSELEGIYKFGNSFKYNHKNLTAATQKKNINTEVSTKCGIDNVDISNKKTEFDYFFYLETKDTENNIEFFTIEVDYRIVFHYDNKNIKREEFTEENVKSLGPTLKNFLWPYFRNLVQEETVSANMPPLMLPPIKIDLLNNENKTKTNIQS